MIVSNKIAIDDLTNVIDEILSQGAPHCMLTYQDLSSFRKIYSLCTKELLERDQVVILWPFYEVVENVRFWLEDSGVDVSGYYQKKQLVIIDALDVYANKEDDIVEIIEEFARYAGESGKSGVAIIGDLGAFRLMKKVNNLLSYEASIGMRVMSNVKLFCCYHVGDIKDLSKGQLGNLCGAHSSKIHVTMDGDDKEKLITC